MSNLPKLLASLSQTVHGFEDKLSKGGFAASIFQDGQELFSVGVGEGKAGEPYTPDTLSLAFSCTKGVSSILIGMLVDQGKLDFDEPVISYWPEFGKVSESLTVAELMQHKAGLSAPRQSLSFQEAINHESFTNALINQVPLWEPGKHYSYHALSFGNLLQELAIRVSAKTLGTLLQELVARPLGADAFIGVPNERLAEVVPLVALEPYLPGDFEAESENWWRERAMNLGGAFPATDIGQPEVGFNSKDLLKAEMPGVNGVFSARGLAKIWSATVADTDGLRLLSDQTLARMSSVSVDEKPFLEDWPWPKRGLGFMIHTEAFRPFLSEGSFGHDGFGGRVGFADPRHRIGFAFTTNRLVQGEGEHEIWLALAKALREGLE